jgi:cytidine deaminase
MTQLDQGQLCELAASAALRAYAPYSRFRVGAALLCADGSIITGVNVENRSFGLTICAERSAIVAAVTAGFTEFKALAVAGVDSGYPLPPCGACRQVMSEFMAADTPVFFRGDDPTAIVESTVGELLPYDSLKELSADSSC